MSATKKLFKATSSSDSTKLKNDNHRNKQKFNNGTISENKQKMTSASKKTTKSLTDEEYKDIFTAVLSQFAEDVEKTDDSESGIEEQNIPVNINPDEELEQNVSALQSAQVLNEATPPVSDVEDKILKLPPSPVKKKKRFIYKESINRKQLSYPHKEKQQVSKNPPCPKKKQNQRKTLKDKLLQLQLQRATDDDGTWVQCCRPECNKWRYLDYVKEPFQVPPEWYCFMNTDPERNSCDKPEADYSNLEFVFTKFAAGSIVWAKLQGFPWWPAMIDDDPLVGEYFWTNGFSDIPTHYNVVFLDDVVSRAWIHKSCIKPFKEENAYPVLESKSAKHQKALEDAVKNAKMASSLLLKDRLMKYSFARKYTGKWPKHVQSHNYYHSQLKKEDKINKSQCIQTKQNMSDTQYPNEELSDAEEILNQLEEIEDFECITSLLNFDSESEEEFIPHSGYQSGVAKSKKISKFNNNIKQHGAKKLCSSSQKSAPDNQKKKKKLQVKNLHKEQTIVHSTEKTPIKLLKKTSLPNYSKLPRNEEVCKQNIKPVKKPNFSMAYQNQVKKKSIILVTNRSKGETKNEIECISQVHNDKVDIMYDESIDQSSQIENVSSYKEYDNAIGKTQKCKLQEETKGKRKLSFYPPKISKANSTIKSESQTKENVPIEQNIVHEEEIKDLQKTDITLSPLFEDSPNNSQKSVLFETEE